MLHVIVSVNLYLPMFDSRPSEILTECSESIEAELCCSDLNIRTYAYIKIRDFAFLGHICFFFNFNFFYKVCLLTKILPFSFAFYSVVGQKFHEDM